MCSLFEVRLHRAAVSIGAALVILTPACDSVEPRVPTSIKLEPESVQIPWGRNHAAITPTILDQHGRPFETRPEGFEMVWSISDGRVARVAGHNAAVVHAVNGGEAILTGAAGHLPPAHAHIEVLPAPDTISGMLSFHYRGDHSGTFAVSGSWPFDHADPGIVDTQEYLKDRQQWVVSHYGSIWGGGVHQVRAARMRPDGREDEFILMLPGHVTEPGTVQVSGGFLTLGIDRRMSPVGIDASYHDATGVVELVSVSDDRIAGTFSLNMLSRTWDGGEVTYHIEVLDGAFDAPLTRDAPWD
jgi:hypothetical protein